MFFSKSFNLEPDSSLKSSNTYLKAGVYPANCRIATLMVDQCLQNRRRKNTCQTYKEELDESGNKTGKRDKFTKTLINNTTLTLTNHHTRIYIIIEMTEKGLSGHKIYMEVKYNMKLSTMKNKKTKQKTKQKRKQS